MYQLLAMAFLFLVVVLPFALLALLLYLAFWLMETLHTLLLGTLDRNLCQLCRSKKRRLLTGGIAFLLAGATFLWLEFGGEHAHLKWKEVPCSQGQILTEMPDIALTDADIALLDAVLAAPEADPVMQGRKENVKLSDKTVRDLTADHVEKPSDRCEIRVTDHGWALSEWIEFCGNDEKELYLSRYLYEDELDSVYKAIRLYRPDSDKELEDILCQYSNHDGVLTKEVLTHDWFHWVDMYLLMFTG